MHSLLLTGPRISSSPMKHDDTRISREVFMEPELKPTESALDVCKEESPELPAVLEEITIEEMAVDGICGIY